MTDGIVVLDLDGACRYADEAVGAILGCRPADLLGRPPWTGLPEDFGLRLRQTCAAAADSSTPIRLVERHAQLGSWFEIRVVPHDVDIVVLFREITTERAEHDELVQQVDRLSEAERIVRFGVWEWEISSGRVRWSDELHRIYGLAPGEFGGTVDAFMEHLHPEDRERVWANISGSMETLESIISVKDLSGRYLMSNAEAGRVLGMSTEDIVGKYCSDLFPPEIVEAQRASDRRAASEGDPVYDELMLIRDGEPRTYVASTFVLPDEDGAPAETCTIATDVTERRGYESARRERTEWSRRITSALDEDRMLVYAQPIIDLRTDVPVFSELLVRMRTAGNPPELLAPASFLPAAERFVLIQAIDIWMVRQATVLPAHLVLEVNLSAVTMCDPAARREIAAVLAAAPHAAERIIFEITETAAATHLGAAETFAHDVERLGCRLALDDFGTGFGSFTYLRRLPLSYVKVDLSFVRGMVQSRDDRRVVQSIIGIAQQFDLATIAEGVENEVTLDLLRELGADYAQGFHLGRPAPLATGPT